MHNMFFLLLFFALSFPLHVACSLCYQLKHWMKQNALIRTVAVFNPLSTAGLVTPPQSQICHFEKYVILKNISFHVFNDM